jgi:hypothetical protein
VTTYSLTLASVLCAILFSPVPVMARGGAEAEPPAVACGTERWRVKIVADGDADKVRIDSARVATIDELRAMAAPVYADTNPRSAAEEQVVTVTAWLVGYKFEAGDSDYHLVIGNDAGETIIAEIPHPDCALGSRVLAQITAARAAFRALVHTPPSPRFVHLRKPIRVRVTGPLFFDRLHGQTGVAPNGVELHPVLSIESAS